MANERLRLEMLKNNVSQARLAEILGINQSQVSAILKYELSKREQDCIIKAIKENA